MAKTASRRLEHMGEEAESLEDLVRDAQAYSERGEHEEALLRGREALSIALGRLGPRAEQSVQLARLVARCALAVSELYIAHDALDDSIEVLRDAPDLEGDTASVIFSAAELARHRSRFQKADGLYLEAEKRLGGVRVSADRDLACVTLRRALVRYELGDIETAERLMDVGTATIRDRSPASARELCLALSDHLTLLDEGETPRAVSLRERISAAISSLLEITESHDERSETMTELEPLIEAMHLAELAASLPPSPKDDRGDGSPSDDRLGAPEELRVELEHGNRRRPARARLMDVARRQAFGNAEGKALYGDPERGATLDQSWRSSMAKYGVSQTALIVPDRVEPPEAIEQVETMGAEELVAAARLLLPRSALQAFVRGSFPHSITLTGRFRSFIRFFDPWPGKSLLARERGYFDVDVVEVGLRLWQINAEDLAKIIYAVFVFPWVWARLTRVPCRVNYPALKSSDLFSWFHLREIESEATAQLTTYHLEPGARRESIAIAISVDCEGLLETARLELERSFLQAEAPLAADLVGSFLAAMVAIPDRECVTPLLRLIRAVQSRTGSALDAAIGDDEVLGNMFSALANRRPSHELAFGFCAIAIDNEARPGWCTINVRMF